MKERKKIFQWKEKRVLERKKEKKKESYMLMEIFKKKKHEAKK